MGQRICSIEGCTDRVRGRGWCNKHLLRAQRHGDPLGGGTSPSPGATCSVEGCDTPHHSKGMCAVHYRRFQRTGQTDLSPRVKKFRPTKVPLTVEEQLWARIKAVYELLDENPSAYATVYSHAIRRALDG